MRDAGPIGERGPARLLKGARRLIRRGAIASVALLVLVAGVRVWELSNGPPLRPWHEQVPAEMPPAAMDRADWAGFLAAGRALFEDIARAMAEALAAEDRVAANRYFSASPLHPGRFAQDWNRSFLLLPEGEPLGAVVLVHGLTDAPFSVRHLAEYYRARGFVAVAPRMPGHGTVPAGLVAARWEDGMAATRLAVRQARARVPAGRPLHLLGYSNGGALVLKHALDALEDPALPRADRLVPVSPMIGVTAFARFAGLAALPAVLTFQSVVDSTASTPAVLGALYANLPANGSEIVLFDINRATRLGPLLRPGAVAALDGLLVAGPRPYRATVVTNADANSMAVVERRTEAGGAGAAERPLGLAWPRDVLSLSHIALPFPVSDGLYGLEPDPADDFGVRLGAIAVRGERGVLVESLDALTRLSSNPFFPYLLDRVAETLPAAR